MTGAPFSRLFAMSAFEATRNIRRFRPHHASLADEELIKVIAATDPGSYDYEAGVVLDGLVPPADGPLTPDLFYRSCIETMVPRQTVWRRVITLGRMKFIQKLSRDEQQCFRSAGLLEANPADEVVKWWARITAELRFAADQEKLERALDAERMSLEYEAARLKKLGIPQSPIWMSIDDNTAGYDILSYDLGPFDPITRLIEVKSTIASPLRFIVTRNEWETALKYGARYFFHVWDMQTNTLHERTTAQITPHIPTDNAKGRWTHAHIPVGN